MALSHRHRSQLSSSALAINVESSPYIRASSSHRTSRSKASSSLPSSSHCSAYFLQRLDLNDYATHTLKQTVDTVVSRTQSKGLKVKLSLPDDGLIVENSADSNQSWMYKRSELLYFWRDPFYAKVIVIVTSNPSSPYYASQSFSASVFRLRGHQSVPGFFQRAQQFFAQLFTPTPIRSSLEKSSTSDKNGLAARKDEHRKRSPHRLIARTEFDPSRTTTITIESNSHPSDRRSYTDTIMATDAPPTTAHEPNNNHLDDDQATVLGNHLSNEYVVELVRELRELRNEIATLKLDARFTPVRSVTTSPLNIPSENSQPKMDLSPSLSDPSFESERNVEQQQTNPTAMRHRREPSPRKSRTAPDEGRILPITSQNRRQLAADQGSSSSMITGTDREGYTLVNSSRANVSPSRKESSYAERTRPPTVFPLAVRPMLAPNQARFTHPDGSSVNYNLSSNNEEESYSRVKSVIIEKEMPKFLSQNGSSSSTTSTTARETVSFRSELDDTVAPDEHIYENIPALKLTDSNRATYFNVPTMNGNGEQASNTYVYLTIGNDPESRLQQQQYLSQLIEENNGLSLLIPQQPTHREPPSEVREIEHHRPPAQIQFADHLTNPLFTTDKQLLANTIANQFGVEPNSPYLDRLIANQHLFTAQKRTFANMIWQMTSEEAQIMSSPSSTIAPRVIRAETAESNIPTAKSILKAKTSVHSIAKRQRITWDSALE